MCKFLLNSETHINSNSVLFVVLSLEREYNSISINTGNNTLCFVKGNNKGEYNDDKDYVDVDGSNVSAGGNDMISVIVLLFNSQNQGSKSLI